LNVKEQVMSLVRAVRVSVGSLCISMAGIGCGGSGGGPTTAGSPPPTPVPQPVTSLISQGSSPLGPSTVAPVPFTTTSLGTLDITVDWTFASNDVDIFLARGTNPCSLETFNDRSCGFIATEESTTMKPSRLRAANIAPGAYSLYVANFGDGDESVAWQVVLTTVSGSSLPSAASSQDRATAKRPAIRIAEPR
jgi:hypothetical protein